LLSRQNARDRPCAPRAGCGLKSLGAFLVHSSRSSIEGTGAKVAESEIAKKAGIIDRKRIPEPTPAYSIAVAPVSSREILKSSASHTAVFLQNDLADENAGFSRE
jgi:hypothetical protein